MREIFAFRIKHILQGFLLRTHLFVPFQIMKVKRPLKKKKNSVTRVGFLHRWSEEPVLIFVMLTLYSLQIFKCILFHSEKSVSDGFFLWLYTQMGQTIRVNAQGWLTTVWLTPAQWGGRLEAEALMAAQWACLACGWLLRPHWEGQPHKPLVGDLRPQSIPSGASLD